MISTASIVEMMRGEDVRYVELTGRERKHPSQDGHIRIDVACPFHDGEDASCWVHFGLDGHGRFVCRPCASIGTAAYSVQLGKRLVELTREGSLDEDEDLRH